MPPLAFALALAAAVLHAFWNILLARARDPESATTVALLAAVIVFAPVTALRFDAEWAVWPFIVVTSMLQLLYFAFSRRRTERPSCRSSTRSHAGSLRVVLVVSVVVLGHGPRRRRSSVSSSSAPACCSFAACAARRSHALAFALGMACVIAAYTLLDKRGITHASPVTYLELSMIPAAIGYAGATTAAKGRERIRAEFGASAVLAGLASFAAYALVLAALERASAASVAAVRETSVVMATVFAAVVLHERVSGTRLAGAVLVVCGIALLALR